MQNAQVGRSVKTKNLGHVVAYHIDPENLGYIAQILRELYSDPIRAVVREYCANAVDAHDQAGIPERPIEITAPTKMVPELRIRDYGFGLSKEDT